MLNYFSNLFQDVCDVGWSASKGCHAALLCNMEDGKLDWEDDKEIDAIRRTYAQRNIGAHSTHSTAQKQKTQVCSKYQRGECTQANDHTYGSTVYRHICQYCFNVLGRQFTHKDSDCMKKHGRNNTHTSPSQRT